MGTARHQLVSANAARFLMVAAGDERVRQTARNLTKISLNADGVSRIVDKRRHAICDKRFALVEMPLPHWDMTNIFPALDAPEFEQGFARAVERVNALAQLFDAQRVQRHSDAITDDATVRAFVATDSRDALAQAKLSALQLHLVTLSKLETRFTAWLGSLDVERLVEQSQIAKAHEYALRRAKIQAAHQMSPVEEELAAELNLTGGAAWSRLHGNVSSQIMVEVELDGETKTLPMSAVRNLAFDARRAVRERAYRAELAAWEHHAVPLAAALNSIKGQMNTLAARRNWESALDEALFDAAIDRATLDAMMTAAREAFPAFRRYLRAKAHALGLKELAWYDIFAPLGANTRVWEYDDARDFILTQFGTYSEKMQGLA